MRKEKHRLEHAKFKIRLQIFYKLIYFSFLVLLFSCKDHKIRRIISDDLIAEGEISSDTIYNGKIKFYDTATNKLVIDEVYENGKLNGQRTDYYLNGKIKSIGYWSDDKELGTVSLFDSSGKMSSQENFYYGLQVGSEIEYKNQKVNEYYFYSFERKVLFYIDYDSILNVPTKQINNDRFFFYRIDSVATISTSDKRLKWNQYFIYLINPPDFHFQYSLCIINKNDSILHLEKKFNSENAWDTFILDSTKLNSGERFSLRLIYDKTMSKGKGEKGDMRKRL
jgi:antitoxin component YwqK of YwqJK toxin-antitoxin module